MKAPDLLAPVMLSGLKRAEALTIPEGRSFRGKLDLGFKATPEFIGGNLEALARLKKGPFDLAGYASAWAGARRFGTTWESDYGAAVGIRGYF